MNISLAITAILEGYSIEEILSEGLSLTKGFDDISIDDAQLVMQAKLQLGDVIVMGAIKDQSKLFHKAYYRVVKGVLGDTKVTHVDLYTGGTKVTTSTMNRGVHQKSLRRILDRRNYAAIYRPRTTEQAKKEAVDYALQQVGKPFGWSNAMKAAVAEMSRFKKKRFKTHTDAFFCAGLVAEAYPDLDVMRGKNRAISPKDFQRSRDFVEVARFKRTGEDKFTIFVM